MDRIDFIELVGWIHSTHHYLGDNSVIETLLTVMLEPVSCCNDVGDKTLLTMKLAGCVGTVRANELLFIMRTTEAIFGLSATFS